MFDWLVHCLIGLGRKFGFLCRDGVIDRTNYDIGQSQACYHFHAMDPALLELQGAQLNQSNTIGSVLNVKGVVGKSDGDWAALYKRNLRFLVNASLANRYIPTSHAVHLSALLIRELRASPANRQEGA